MRLIPVGDGWTERDEGCWAEGALWQCVRVRGGESGDRGELVICGADKE